MGTGFAAIRFRPPPSSPQAFTYDGLKQLAADLDRPVATLVALSTANDPFYIGPARQEDAVWFADLWSTFDFGGGIHLRRLHYVFVSQAVPLQMRDGTPYENTEDCWQRLVAASGSARYLKLVPIEGFVDRRNAPAIINASDGVSTGAGIGLSADGLASVPTHYDLPELPSLELIEPVIEQRFLVELWAEKTTMNDILLPLAELYGINVVTGAGELSLTACHLLIERAKADGRPVRILYVSDFDPAGQSMPVAIARKIEFLIRDGELDLDVQVRPVILTAEQCSKYRLPRTPIKDTERRAGAFEARYGEGATELDALEALHPGELRGILESEILRYFDVTLQEQVDECAQDRNDELDEINARVHAHHAAEINALTAEHEELTEKMSQWREKAEPVWQAVQDSLQVVAPGLSDVEWPEPDEGDEDPEPLFDSRRTYVEQMDVYKRHQGKPTSRKIQNRS
jgi:hypothetical protein